MKTKVEKKKKIKWYELALFILVVLVLVFLVLTFKNNDLKAHCTKAICNEENTICYNYEMDASGNTQKIWEGNCSKVK